MRPVRYDSYTGELFVENCEDRDRGFGLCEDYHSGEKHSIVRINSPAHLRFHKRIVRRVSVVGIGKETEIRCLQDLETAKHKHTSSVTLLVFHTELFGPPPARTTEPM